MNDISKQARLEELKSSTECLSDQEIDEMEKLEQELETNGQENVIKQRPVLKQKRTIMQVLADRFKEKPATYQEIEQLRLEVIRKRAQADIAQSKAKIQKAKSDRLNSFLGSTLGNPSSKETDIRDLYDGKDTMKKYRALIGDRD